MSHDFLARNKRFKDRPARLLHVGPFRLDESADGLPRLPERFRHLNATAPQAAMIRVFDAAIEHKVDAVLVSGGLPNPDQVGFRPLVLAFEQCRRLIRHRIPVIAPVNPALSGSRFDYLRRPKNVFYLEDSARQAITIGDTGRRGRLDIGAPTMVSNARLRVVMASATTAAGKLTTRSDAEYIALGEAANAQQHPKHGGSIVTWDAGSPQGRCVQESGPHGALLVTIGRNEATVVRPIACDVLRHHDILVEAADGMTWDGLHQTLWSDAERLRADHAVPAHVVHWTVQSRDLGHLHLHSMAAQHDLLDAIRGAFGTPASGPAVWPASLSISTDDGPLRVPTSEETSLGRFVRTLESQRPNHRGSALARTVPLLV